MMKKKYIVKLRDSYLPGKKSFETPLKGRILSWDRLTGKTVQECVLSDEECATLGSSGIVTIEEVKPKKIKPKKRAKSPDDGSTEQ